MNSKELNENNFPKYFPKEVIKKIYKIKHGEIEVYRVCRSGKIECNSFLNSYEERSEIHDYSDFFEGRKEIDIGDYSLSCNEKQNDANKRLEFFTRKSPLAILAKGLTKKEYGIAQRTKERKKNKNSHVDWWLYEDKNPVKLFYKVEGK